MRARRKALLDKVQAASDRAARWPAAFRVLEAPTFENSYPLVLGYVRDKFLLEPGECVGDLILDLADVSLRKLLRLKREGRLTGDISRGCSGASSVITKKVLLMKAAQEDFGIFLTPEQAAAAGTVTQLTQAILAQRT